MSMVDINYKQYEMLRFVVKYGKGIAVFVALFVAASGLYFAYIQQSIVISIVSIFVAVMFYGLLGILTELVSVISEMLLPR